MNMDGADYLEFIQMIVLEAGELLENAFHDPKSKQLSFKEFNEVVTETDKQVEKFVFSRILKKYPGHLLVGEETACDTWQEGLSQLPTWILDPIDGTTCFVHGLHQTCISLALAIGDKLVAACIHAPILKETFTAARGHGAYLNSKPIHVSNCSAFKDALVATNVGYWRDKKGVDFITGNINRVLRAGARSLHCCGSCALDLANVAAGRKDAYYEWGIKIWDYAAGSLLIEEAGGIACDPSGSPLDLRCRRILAGTPEIVAKLTKTLDLNGPC